MTLNRRQFADTGPQGARQQAYRRRLEGGLGYASALHSATPEPGYGLHPSSPHNQAVEWVDRNRRIEAHVPLPGMGDIPMAEPHQQTQEEFSRDPRTWFHGRYAEDLPAHHHELKEASGLHVGTELAATQRLQTLGPPKEIDQIHVFGADPEATVPIRATGRIFPLRLTTGFSNKPEDPMKDQGTEWPKYRAGRYYVNEVEDPGSVSAYVPSREGVMSHRQFVAEALTEGKKVRPRVAAEFAATGGEQGPHFDPERPFTWRSSGMDWAARRKRIVAEDQAGHTLFASLNPGDIEREKYVPHGQYKSLSTLWAK